jgi:hypothetical protein
MGKTDRRKSNQTMKKDMIKELERERDELESKQIRLQRIINDLKEFDKPNKLPIVRTKSNCKSLKVTIRHQSKRGKYAGKWTDEIVQFIRDNKEEMGNEELAKAIKSKFGLKCGASNVANTMFNHHIKRDKKVHPDKPQQATKGKLSTSEIAKKAYHGPYKKHTCELCHEREWKAGWDGKQLCQRCFDLKKKGEETVNRKERKDPEHYDDDDDTDETMDVLEEE